jgi:RND family efflux transporter MFP subunit
VTYLLKKILPVTVMVFIAAGTLLGCKEKIKPGHTEVKRPEIRGVTVAKVVTSTIDSAYETSGTVMAKTTSTLASRVFGTITTIHVKEGDTVRSGDVLLVIDDRDARQRVNAAEAGYNEALKAREAAEKRSGLADITSRRYGNLYKEKVVTQQEFDQIETRRNVTNLELEQASLASERAKALQEEARIHFGYTRVRAPFPGVITAKKVEQGSMAVPGMPVITIEDTSRYKIAVRVDERLLGKLRPGTPVKVHFDGGPGTVTGTITKIVPAVDPATRTFVIEAELKDAALKSGLYGRVLIPEGTKEAIIVAPSAIVQKGQLTGVYVVDDKDVAGYRLIRKGKTLDKGVEVLSGLKNGDRVIVTGTQKAVDGGTVRDR